MGGEEMKLIDKVYLFLSVTFVLLFFAALISSTFSERIANYLTQAWLLLGIPIYFFFLPRFFYKIIKEAK